MTHDDITLAFRMLARGMPNHEAVTRLSEALAAVMKPPPEPPAANPPTPAPKSDSIPLSRPKKR